MNRILTAAGKENVTCEGLKAEHAECSEGFDGCWMEPPPFDRGAMSMK